MLARHRRRRDLQRRAHRDGAQQQVAARHGRSAHAALTALIVSLCVLGQFAGVAHLLLVRHVACPVHGELMHAAGGDAPRFEHVHGEQLHVAAITGVETEVDGYHDEHCAVVGHRREQALAVSAQVHGVQAVEASAWTPALHTAAIYAGLARYAVAPKTSPPS
jgi:hypothetical protein